MRNKLKEWLLSRAVQDVYARIPESDPVFSSLNKERGEMHISFHVENFSYTDVRIAEVRGLLVQGDDIPLVGLDGGTYTMDNPILSNRTTENRASVVCAVSLDHFFWLQSSVPYVRIHKGAIILTGSFGQAVIAIPDTKGQPSNFSEVRTGVRTRMAPLLKDILKE